MTRVYLIRHCEAQGNIQRIFHGQTDSGISKNGRKQLEFLAERCRSYSFDAVFSSPLFRAYQTAKAADLYHSLPITTLPGLMEINGGHWENRYFADLPALFPEEFHAWTDEPWNFRPQGGESMRELYGRIWNTVTGVVSRLPGKSVCVVSHGCAIRNFLCRAYELPLERLDDIPWCDNTAVSIVDFDEKLRPNVVLSNDSSHLEYDYSTIRKQDWWKKGKNK